MLTVGKLFEALNGLPPDTQVIIGIIEGGRHTALDAMREVGVEPGPALLYILCELVERPIRPPASPPAKAEPAEGRTIDMWADAPPSVSVPTGELAAIVPIKDACPKCGDRSALRLARPATGEIECLACGHVFRPGGGAGSTL